MKLRRAFHALLTVLTAAVCGLGLVAGTVPLTGCSAAQQAEFTTTAEKIGGDVVTYGQTLGQMLVTGSAVVAQTAPAIESLAQQWGMLPANSNQLATYNKVVSAVALAGQTGAELTSLLTQLQTSGTVPAAVVPATSFLDRGANLKVAYIAPLMRPGSPGLRPVYGWTNPYNVRLAVR